MHAKAPLAADDMCRLMDRGAPRPRIHGYAAEEGKQMDWKALPERVQTMFSIAECVERFGEACNTDQGDWVAKD